MFFSTRIVNLLFVHIVIHVCVSHLGELVIGDVRVFVTNICPRGPEYPLDQRRDAYGILAAYRKTREPTF